MTPASAIRLVSIGALAVLASCAPLGTTLDYWFSERPKISLPIAADGQLLPTRAVLTAGRSARINLAIGVAGAIDPTAGQAGSPPALARFRIPFSFRIVDAQGAVIQEQRVPLDSEKLSSEGFLNATNMPFRITREPGSNSPDKASFSLQFRSFEVPDDPALFVSAALASHDKHSVTVTDANLVLEHDIMDPTVMVVFGVFMLVCGWMTAVIGLIAVIQRSPLQPDGSQSAQAGLGPAVKRQSMLCHLAALAGLAVPVIGNLLGPLYAWHRYRSTHGFVDRNGIQSLNFQLSMTAYLLLSFSLTLALIGLIMLPLLISFQIATVLFAARRAAKGETFEYPLTIRFVH